MMEVIGLIIGTVLILIGLVIVSTSVFGNFHFKYVLNRMQVSAMEDTLGILFILLGLIFYSGIGWLALKLLLVIVFFWISSPTSSHLLVQMEVLTNPNLMEEVEVIVE